MQKIQIALRVIIIFSISCTPLRPEAQNQSQATPVDNISVKDGLPSNKVYDLALGNASTLWVATQNGIAAINGNKIKNKSHKLI